MNKYTHFKPITDVDKEFDNGYYRFFGTVRKDKCIVCNKSFETSLSLLKTCSVAHRDRMLDMLTGKR